ncbi:hypothetical protein LR48_Vigan08g129200 [Vigna angularis]|uniref:Uncharacterized protein n=1 Tax=Phaseolus angularis TaxID=3914 RepID=A0A0L9V5Z9_PHAAN|nr:hypothetical protein LR48_Vigan08g129200 [Vigna angularis]
MKCLDDPGVKGYNSYRSISGSESQKIFGAADYGDSLSESIRSASHPGEMLSARALTQRIDALCEWFERLLSVS